MNRLVVFDLDDTLYLERDFVRGGFRAVGEYLRRERGVRGFFRAAWRRFASGDRALIIDRVLAEEGVAAGPGLVRKLLSVYRAHRPRLRLCADARRFLERPPEGVELAVITDGRLPVQRAKVRALGVDKLVGEIVCTGRWGPRYAKPHPRAFRLLERRFRRKGSDCLYIGDNPAKDFEAPRERGWTAVRLRRPAGLHVGASGPEVLEMRSCDELRKWLARREGSKAP